MSRPHRVHPEALPNAPPVGPSERQRGPSESGPVRAGDYQSSAFDDDLNNPLAVVLTNLDLLSELMPRMRDGLSQGNLDANAALAAHVADAQSCVDDARAAGERLRAVARRAKRPSVPPSPLGDPEPTPDRSGLRPARILIVDDDERLARALGRVFRDYDVVVHVSPLDALQKLAGGERFDVIVSDVMMPAMRGFDLHAEIRRFAPAQADRMVFLTGGCASEADAEALSATGQPVLSKPFDPKELRAFVKKFLG